MLTKAPFHIIYHQFTVNSFNTENPPADTNKVGERRGEPCQAQPSSLALAETIKTLINNEVKTIRVICLLPGDLRNNSPDKKSYKETVNSKDEKKFWYCLFLVRLKHIIVIHTTTDTYVIRKGKGPFNSPQEKSGGVSEVKT